MENYSVRVKYLGSTLAIKIAENLDKENAQIMQQEVMEMNCSPESVFSAGHETFIGGIKDFPAARIMCTIYQEKE